MSSARPEINFDPEFLHELEPEAARLLDRHLAQSKLWNPSDYIPYELTDRIPRDVDWSKDIFPVPNGIRSALYVNLLTEDNLPYYSREIQKFTGDGKFEALFHWTRRWTAEEGRHSHAIRGFLDIARIVDLDELEQGRMAQVEKAEVPEPETTEDGLVYVSFQEPDTRIAHLNTGKQLFEAVNGLEDSERRETLLPLAKAGKELLTRVAIDENFHFLLYRDLAGYGFQVDPSRMVMAVERQLRGFAMPGTGIPNFNEHTLEIAKRGIFDLYSHLDQVIRPVVFTPQGWDLNNVSGLSGDAEAARERINAYFEKRLKRAKSLNERLQEQVSRTES